jgi:ABC-type sugar transport system ATPase subunit
MIFVTHDQVEAMTLGRKIVVFNARRIEQVGTPLELYERPANLFGAGFLGSPRMNAFPVLPCRCRRPGPRLLQVETSLTGGSTAFGRASCDTVAVRTDRAEAACQHSSST